MSRLWDKGVDLDQRVLDYTAGDDYALDERLVKYDVRASIAHAEMLNAQKLLPDFGDGLFLGARGCLVVSTCVGIDFGRWQRLEIQFPIRRQRERRQAYERCWQHVFR